MRIVIINDTSDRKNWGCQATSFGLHDQLRATYGADTTLTCIPLLGYDRFDQHCDLTLKDAIAGIFRAPTLSAKQRRLLAKVAETRYHEYLPALKTCDLVVFQAEGTMTGKDYVTGLRLLVLPLYCREILGRRVLSLNQTLFCHNDDFADLVRRVMSRFDLVALREPASHRYAHLIGLTDSVLIPDTAFLAEPQTPSDEILRKLPTRFFAFTGTAIAALASTENYSRLINEIARATGLTPVFMGSTDEDKKFFRELAIPGAINLSPALNGSGYRIIVDLLSRAAFLVGGRYHMAIMAAVGGTPSLLTPTNTFKNLGLARLLPRGVHHLADLETGPAVTAAMDVLARDETLRSDLRATVRTLRDAITGSFRHLPKLSATTPLPAPSQPLHSPDDDAWLAAIRELHARSAALPHPFTTPTFPAETWREKLQGLRRRHALIDSCLRMGRTLVPRK